MSTSIKKGDNVVVIAGKEKGKTGKVTEVSSKNNRVLVDGVNIVTKHQKARKQDEKSQIIKKNAPIEASNVMVVCPSCGKATRIAHSEVDGKKVRTCKKCKASLDKEFAKAVKKETKKTVKTAETTEKKSSEKTATQKSKKTATAKTEA
jgi:large subunit ribosomal protein L24